MNTIKKIGPRTEPCGTPLIVVFHELCTVPIRTRCSRSERYDLIILIDWSWTPQALNFAIRSSCGMQSKALLRSINKAPILLFFKRSLRKFSIRVSSVSWQPYPCLKADRQGGDKRRWCLKREWSGGQELYHKLLPKSVKYSQVDNWIYLICQFFVYRDHLCFL